MIFLTNGCWKNRIVLSKAKQKEIFNKYPQHLKKKICFLENGKRSNPHICLYARKSLSKTIPVTIEKSIDWSNEIYWYDYYFYSSQLGTHMIERYHQLITKEHAFFAKYLKKNITAIFNQKTFISHNYVYT